MAGTLTVGTLSDGTNSTSATTVISGSAKVWSNFSAAGGTISIRASFNISSITRGGTGDYTANYSNALTDGNYSTVFGTQQGTDSFNLNAYGGYSSAPTLYTSTQIRLRFSDYGSQQGDPYLGCFAIFR
jgi:hypothetical protein